MSEEKDLAQLKKEAAEKARRAALEKLKAREQGNVAATSQQEQSSTQDDANKEQVETVTPSTEREEGVKTTPTAEEKAKAAALAKEKAMALAKARAEAKAQEENGDTTGEEGEKTTPTADEKAKAAAAAKAKAAAAAKARAAALAKAKATEMAQENGDGEQAADEKAKAAAAAKAKAAAAAKAKAAAAAKAKAAAMAKEGGAGGTDDEKAKAIAAAKAKAAAAAKAKAVGKVAETIEAAPETPSPNQPYLDKYVKVIEKHLGLEVLEDYYINRLSKDVPTLVAKKESYFKMAEFLRYNEQLSFDYLSELHGVDYETHMEVYVHLYSYKNNQSVALKVKLDRDEPTIDSLCPLWAGANWPECEAYDLLGIKFTNHPNLHRIFLGEDWVGHPLRKDYEPYDVEV